MAMSSTIPPLDWLVGFQRNVYRINWELGNGMEFFYVLGWNLDTMGMMGMLRGNLCREGV